MLAKELLPRHSMMFEALKQAVADRAPPERGHCLRGSWKIWSSFAFHRIFDSTRVRQQYLKQADLSIMSAPDPLRGSYHLKHPDCQALPMVVCSDHLAVLRQQNFVFDGLLSTYAAPLAEYTWKRRL